MCLNIVIAYFTGVIFGHYLLLRRIKKVKAQVASSNEVRARIGKRPNVLTQSESTRYMRWIWLWPVYTSTIFPIRFVWWLWKQLFIKLGLGEFYADVADRLAEMGNSGDNW